MIHYHGSDINPVDVAITIWRTRHALISFARPDQVAIAAEVCSG